MMATIARRLHSASHAGRHGGGSARVRLVCVCVYLVKYMWIPPHVGLRGNEFVDRLAKKACQRKTAVYQLDLWIKQIKSKMRLIQHEIKQDASQRKMQDKDISTLL